jgi:hypothetical protein
VLSPDTMKSIEVSIALKEKGLAAFHYLLTLPPLTSDEFNVKPLDMSLIKLDDINMHQVSIHEGEHVDQYYKIKMMFEDLVDWVISTGGFDAYYGLFINHTTDLKEDQITLFTEDHMGIYWEGVGLDSDQGWRIVWRDVVISWYKHPRRVVSASRLMSDNEIRQFYDESMVFMTKIITDKGWLPGS